jgi:type III pantothenate kinase
VNPKIKDFKNGINLEPYFQLESDYKGMGIDRVAACYNVENAVVVDAGSAITVDVMEDGRHLGGFIMAGIGAYKESLASISSNLICKLDEKIELESLPNNTNDALNFAIFRSIYLMIEDVSKDKKIIFCGGDGELLGRFFKGSSYRKNMVFDGMIKVIKEMGC